jgi:hypothetical protein
MLKPRSITLRSKADLDRLARWLDENWIPFSQAETPLVVKVAQEDLPRSDEENAWYWGFLLRQIEEQGVDQDGLRHSAKVWHEFFREAFAPRVDRETGLSVPMSTSQMLSSTFSRYCKDVEHYAATYLHVVFKERL